MNDDILRHILDKTLLAAKKSVTETGFVATQDKIPLYDNFLYALLLFRTKTQEHVLEGKKILDHLLYFQQNFTHVGSVGNYPLLVSDFPFCHDHLQALRILCVKLWIQKEFHVILGADLKNRLADSIHKCKTFLERIRAEIHLPFWAKVKLAACVGEEVDLAHGADLRTWGDPVALGELITAYQIAQKGNWEPLWAHLAASWHAPSSAFTGPAYKLGMQNPFLAQALSLFCHSKAPDSYPLMCALLQNNHQMAKLSLPHTEQGIGERFAWALCQEEAYAYSHLVGQESLERMPGFFPFYLVSGASSLAIQAPYGYASDKLVFEIPETVFTDEKEKSRALCIWYNDLPENEVLVDGVKATCFDMNDTIRVTLGKLTLEFSFRVLAGDGVFVGHISRANRSGLQGPRFSAADVQLLLRAIRGSKPTTLQVTVSVENKSLV